MDESDGERWWVKVTVFDRAGHHDYLWLDFPNELTEVQVAVLVSDDLKQRQHDPEHDHEGFRGFDWEFDRPPISEIEKMMEDLLHQQKAITYRLAELATDIRSQHKKETE